MPSSLPRWRVTTELALFTFRVFGIAKSKRVGMIKHMSELENEILAVVTSKSYKPMKPKSLAKRLGLEASQYGGFRRILKELVKLGRLQFGKDHYIRSASLQGTVTGVFRRLPGGKGVVRPNAGEPNQKLHDIAIPDHATRDASTGDEVLVKLLRKPTNADRLGVGEVMQILSRSTRQFVGTYHERNRQGYVRVSGTVFAHSIWVGDPGAKGARMDDQVVIEMLRFPTLEDVRGEAVISEVLGQRGQPGVDLISTIRSFNLPDQFPDEVLDDARHVAEQFDEKDLQGRHDFTKACIITIDPIDAHDFDDAIALQRDPKNGHWLLSVHIADVSHFVPLGSELDREARRRGTSVYLPQRVLPMLPELISNGLASLQQGRVRFVKSALMEFNEDGKRVHSRFVNGAINVRRRFHYDEVSQILANPDAYTDEQLTPEIRDLLLRMREFAMILRERRVKRGALEMSMPKAELEYDKDGKVNGAHFAKHDISHQVIEEFMLAANEAVAEHFTGQGTAILRRVHPAPEPASLEAFADFARSIGYPMKRVHDRFELQRVLRQSADKPEAPAVHFALLKSLKQAIYSPRDDEHFALASTNYCHFTSPIRRYPDLVVHRLLQQFIERNKAGSDFNELLALGDHCSRTERRAEKAERELVRTKLLTYCGERIGMKMPAIITGVADYGFFAQGVELPVEGLVHISTLSEDYFYFDDREYTLYGKRSKKSYRLGDKIVVEVVRVDLDRRQLDLRVVTGN